MMKLKNYFILFIISCFSSSICAQDINGKKIFISETAEIMLKFHSTIEEYQFINKEASNWIKVKRGTLATTITITTEKENFAPTSIRITEGKNVHTLSLIYKKELDDKELSYDFSDLKKLAALAKELEDSQVNQTVIPNTAAQTIDYNPGTATQNTQPNTATGNKNSETNTAIETEPAEDYFDLVIKANTAYGAGKYNEAKELYNRASLLDPSKPWPKDQIVKIDKKIADAQKEIESAKTDAQYKNLMALAEKAVNEKNYTDAKDFCNQALNIKPNDASAQYKLKEIDTKIADEANRKEAQKIDEAYKGFMKTGNENFQKGLYDDARNAYSQALLIKPKDYFAEYQLKEIDKKLDEKKKQDDIRKRDDAYESFMNLGNNYLNEGSLEEAKSAFIQALSVKPDDADAKNKLKQIENKIADNRQKANQKTEDSYKSFMNAGNQALNDASYEEAKNAYKQALSLKPGDPSAQLKLNEIDKKVQDEKKQQDNKKAEEAYNSYMAKGKDNIDKGLYEDAKNAYNTALMIKPNDTEARQQLEKIKTITNDIAERKKQEQKKIESDEKYTALINLADTAFAAGIFDVAREQYKNALTLKPGESYPLGKIKEIENILATITAEQNRKKQDSLTNLKYDEAIKKGDNAIDNSDFKNARIAYQLAQKLKPGEQYPQEKISEIDITLKDIEDAKKAEEAEKAEKARIERQYNFALNSGNEALQKENYEMAKKAFAEAANLKPEEQLPQEKLLFVSNKIDEIARQAETEEKFEQATAMGDSVAFNLHDYVEALKWYRQASALKPADTYSKSQITYLQGILTKKDSVERVTLKEEERIKNFTEGMDAYKRGNQARTELRYEDAIAEYKYFLTKVDTTDLNAYQYGQKQFVVSARDYITRIEEYLARTRPKKDTAISVTVDSLKNLSAVNKNDSSASIFYYPIPKDIDIGLLNQKYPGIEFNQPPPEQKFSNPVFNYEEQTSIIRSELLNNAATLKLANTDAGIHLNCTNISFSKGKVYFKFVLQNSDTAEFLCGAVSLQQVKNDNTITGLLPGYISDFPILMPGKEKTLIYVINETAVADSDTLNFEIADRLNKRKLKIVISGSVYNKEKK